jgi:hypothetical protein
MPQFKTALVAAVLTSVIAGGTTFAQPAQKPTPPPNTGRTSATTANPELQKQLAPERRAMKRQRRDECEREAKQKKLGLGKRWRFMRRCLKS